MYPSTPHPAKPLHKTLEMLILLFHAVAHALCDAATMYPSTTPYAMLPQCTPLLHPRGCCHNVPLSLYPAPPKHGTARRHPLHGIVETGHRGSRAATPVPVC